MDNKNTYKQIGKEVINDNLCAYIEKRTSVNTDTMKEYDSYYLCIDTDYGTVSRRINPYKINDRMELILDIIARGKNG